MTVYPELFQCHLCAMQLSLILHKNQPNMIFPPIDVLAELIHAVKPYTRERSMFLVFSSTASGTKAISSIDKVGSLCKAGEMELEIRLKCRAGIISWKSHHGLHEVLLCESRHTPGWVGPQIF